MSIAFVRNSGQASTTSPVGGGAIALPITAGAVGNNLVVAVATAAATGAVSCTDSSGTSYNLDAEVSSGTAITVMIFSARITTPGVTSISINGFGASLIVEAAAYEFSGMTSASWFDTKGSGTGIGTSVSAGPTVGNLTEGDAWVAVFGSTAAVATFTASGATGMSGANQVGGSLGAEYQLAPTAGSKATGTGSFSTTGTWAALIVAYKAAIPAVLPLGAAGGSSGGSIAVAARTGIPFSSAAASSTGTLAVAASTSIPLAPAAAQSEAGGPGLEPGEELQPGEGLYPGLGDLPLTAPALIALGVMAGGSSGSLTATTSAPVPLVSAAGQSTATLTTTTTGVTPLEPAVGQSTGSLGVTARTSMTLEPAEGVSGGSLFLSAHLDLRAAQGVSSATLAGTAATFLALTPAVALSGGTLQDTATTSIPLAPAAAQSEAGGPGLEPGEELQPGEGLYPGLGDLPIYVPTQIVLAPGNSTSSGSLRVRTTPVLAGLVNPTSVAGTVT